MGEPIPTIRNLDAALADDNFAWSLMLVGEDQTDKLANLTSDLRGPYSETGDGKQVGSGFCYWGIGPTMAWTHVSNDPLYLVGKAGSETFVRHWKRVGPHVMESHCHLVSLGVGTGEKDRVIIKDLVRGNPRMLYLPVDMSSEMLRMGTQRAVRDTDLPMSQVLAIQIDFTIQDNIEEVGQMLARLVGDQPILYTLTGNTLANFDDDQDVLAMITQVLRPQDRLLLEVATTARLDQQAAAAAAEEYRQTRASVEFVTSALRYNTDLKIDYASVLFQGSVEDDEALFVKIMFKNVTGSEIRMALPDNTESVLPANDTIRLLTTRKYSEVRLKKLCDACRLEVVDGVYSLFRQSRQPSSFGLGLLLLAPRGATGTRSATAASEVGDEVWKR